MRPHLLERLAPRCFACGGLWRAEGASASPLLVHGWLRCSNAACDARVPVLDGIPVLTPAPESSLATNATAWLRREDLPEDLDGLLNAATGANSWSDAPRQQVSTYAWDHYGDLDPDVDEQDTPPGEAVRLLDEALALLPEPPSAPVLDVGCATGRTTLHLASRTSQPALGVDLNAAFLRVAQGVLRNGRVRYELRRNGVRYTRREHEVILPDMEEADFWMADAAQLPFAPDTFGLVCALNVIDSCADPNALLRELWRVLRPGGNLLVAAPFDWSPAVTPAVHWLGGHPGREDPAEGLRNAARAAGFTVIAEREGLPWTLRLHDRSAIAYRSMVLALSRP